MIFHEGASDALACALHLDQGGAEVVLITPQRLEDGSRFMSCSQPIQFLFFVILNHLFFTSSAPSLQFNLLRQWLPPALPLFHLHIHAWQETALTRRSRILISHFALRGDSPSHLSDESIVPSAAVNTCNLGITWRETCSLGAE